jgi:PHP family Zn ribbon phosphoesterase
MDIKALAKWSKIKGISMMGSGDFTHPVWLSELKNNLEKVERGVYLYDGTYFVLTAEVSNIYFKAGRTRKVHNLIFAPSFEIVEEINGILSGYGDLSSDGRPILSLECDKMVKMLSAIDPDIFFIPAHAWTPHFSIFGSNSGFDRRVFRGRDPQDLFYRNRPFERSGDELEMVKARQILHDV